jgi:hypothetical protein
MKGLQLSSLAHTWIIDIDGTVLRHNGHKDSRDQVLNGVIEFWEKIPEKDFIILVSAREEIYLDSTLQLLQENRIRYDRVIFGVPRGERIMINDIKPTGMKTAYAINVERDCGLGDLKFTYSG